MRKETKIFCLFSVLLLSMIVPDANAAGLPALPTASRIKTGVLDNGISYYIVTNATEKGRADIALVQKGGYACDTESTLGSTSVNMMGSLTELPHFKTRAPSDFLSGNCIWPDEKGYAVSYPDATVYRFNNLELGRSKDIVDSTLLLVFDIIGMQAEDLGGRYVPQNHAIIISGDVDASAVLGKMNILSMLVANTRPAPVEETYTWNGTEKPAFSVVPSDTPGIVSISAEYAYPRTRRENMNTVQPLVSQRYASELGILLRRRLRRTFTGQNIPIADIIYSYTSSKDGPGDEMFKVGVRTSEKYLSQATSILAGVLADLDADGSSLEEYKAIQTDFAMRMKRDYKGDYVYNDSYVRQCVAAYLYGASLASSATSIDFFLSKNVNDELSLKLFNNFIFALLDKSRNLTLECVADSTSSAGMLDRFESSWKSGEFVEHAVNYSDTLKFSKKKTPKLKIKTMTTEPLSGGQFWVFDNGLKVIYKNVPNTGFFHYTWLLKGGYSLLPGLKYGEGAYVSDMFGLYDVQGVSSYDFADMMSANGITMDCDVTMSDVRISGTAPSSRLQLLLKSLGAHCYNGSINRSAFDYYRQCQELELAGGTSSAAKLDSLMFPGNVYTPYKRSISLSSDFIKRAEKFYSSEFSRMNDGVLILIGDFDELELKKDLCRLLSAFNTDKVSAFRAKTQSRAGSAHNWEIVDGGHNELSLCASAPLSYTAANYMASFIAALVLQDRVSAELADCGWYGRADWNFSMLPEERFEFRLHCAMSERHGLSASLVPVDSVEAVLSRIRMSMSKARISSSELSVYRSILLKHMERSMADPKSVMQMLVLRYSYAKDIVTKYKEKANAVTVDNVNEILKALDGGRLAEYAVKRPHSNEIYVEQTAPAYKPEIPRLAYAVDSLGIAHQGFRAIGLDSTAFVRKWADDALFREFMKELPQPRKLQLKAKPDTLKPVPASVDTLSAGKLDSLVTSRPDSLAQNVADGLKTNMVADSLKANVVADGLKADGLVDSLSVSPVASDSLKTSVQ